MLTVRHLPRLATPALWERLKRYAAYDALGRATGWLVAGGARRLDVELAGIALAVCPEVPLEDWEHVLVQCYRDGAAATVCHSDADKTGLSFVLSLGATRTLRTHRAPTGEVCVIDRDLDVVLVECAHGTVVIMDADFHRHHHHRLIADPGAGERFGLVFRTNPGRA